MKFYYKRTAKSERKRRALRMPHTKLNAGLLSKTGV